MSPLTITRTRQFMTRITLGGIVMLMFIASQLRAESIPARLWESPGPAQDSPDAPHLLIVWPEAGAGPVDAEQTRYAGRVEPEGSQVTLNGTPLEVLPGGVFTGLYDLPANGEAVWNFTARSHAGHETTVTRTVKRLTPPPPPASWPPEFSSTPLWPSGHYWLPKTATLPLTVYASPGARVYYRWGSDGEWTQLKQRGEPGNRGASYVGQLKMSDAPFDAGHSAPIELRIRKSRSGNERSEKIISRLTVGLLDTRRRPWGEVSVFRSTFFRASSGWDVQGILSQKTAFQIFRVEGSRMEIGWEGETRGWVSCSDVQWPVQSPQSKDLSGPQVSAGPRGLMLTWNDVDRLWGWVDYAKESDDPLAFHWRGWSWLYGPNERYKFNSSSSIENARIIDNDNDGEQTLKLNLKAPLWGYRWFKPDADRNQARLELITAPLLKPSKTAPLADMHIVIDPGHGGSDTGALGPSGLTEADINLVLSMALEAELVERGAQVTLLRTDDRYISLDDRVLSCEALHPDLVLSIHHNNVPLSRDPWLRRGKEIYYHSPASRELSERLAQALGDVGAPGEDPPRVYQRNLRVNRYVTQCPSILIETGFLSHPDEERLLSDMQTHRKHARAIAQALVDYMASLSTDHIHALKQAAGISNE